MVGEGAHIGVGRRGVDGGKGVGTRYEDVSCTWVVGYGRWAGQTLWVDGLIVLVGQVVHDVAWVGQGLVVLVHVLGHLGLVGGGVVVGAGGHVDVGQGGVVWLQTEDFLQ